MQLSIVIMFQCYKHDPGLRSHKLCRGQLVTGTQCQNTQQILAGVCGVWSGTGDGLGTPPATIHDPGANSSFETLFAVWVQPFAMQICLFNSLWLGGELAFVPFYYRSPLPKWSSVLAFSDSLRMLSSFQVTI